MRRLAFLSVLMGIGGGSFGVPLMSLCNAPIRRAVATAAGFGVVIAGPSVAGFLMTRLDGAPPYTAGAVNLPAFAVIIAMTLITRPWGCGSPMRWTPSPRSGSSLRSLRSLRSTCCGRRRDSDPQRKCVRRQCASIP